MCGAIDHQPRPRSKAQTCQSEGFRPRAWRCLTGTGKPLGVREVGCPRTGRRPGGHVSYSELFGTGQNISCSSSVAYTDHQHLHPLAHLWPHHPEHLACLPPAVSLTRGRFGSRKLRKAAKGTKVCLPTGLPFVYFVCFRDLRVPNPSLHPLAHLWPHHPEHLACLPASCMAVATAHCLRSVDRSHGVSSRRIIAPSTTSPLTVSAPVFPIECTLYASMESASIKAKSVYPSINFFN